MISRRLHKDWRVFVLVANSVTIPENFMIDCEDSEPQMREALLSQTLANDKVKTINLNNIRGLWNKSVSNLRANLLFNEPKLVRIH